MQNMDHDTSLKSTKISGSFEAEISAPADIVFPLLCPVREYDWISTWKCEMVQSESGVAEKLCVFITDTEPFGKETWICTRYNFPREIQYTRFGTNAVSLLDISLIKDDRSKSTWLWSLSSVSLNEEGNRVFVEFDAGAISQKLKSINQLLEYYITHGQKLEM